MRPRSAACAGIANASAKRAAGPNLRACLDMGVPRNVCSDGGDTTLWCVRFGCRKATVDGESGRYAVTAQDTAVDKKHLSERDICTKFITPALQRVGWDVASARGGQLHKGPHHRARQAGHPGKA